MLTPPTCLCMRQSCCSKQRNKKVLFQSRAELHSTPFFVQFLKRKLLLLPYGRLSFQCGNGSSVDYFSLFTGCVLILAVKTCKNDEKDGSYFFCFGEFLGLVSKARRPRLTWYIAKRPKPSELGGFQQRLWACWNLLFPSPFRFFFFLFYSHP